MSDKEDIIQPTNPIGDSSTDVSNEPAKVVPVSHTPRGRFAKGNKCGKGNPQAKKVADYRQAFSLAMTADDIRDIVLVLRDKAKAGEDWAVKYALDRALGKATQNLNVETNGTIKTYLNIDTDAV